MIFAWDSKPILDEDSVFWLFDTFAWSLQHFNCEGFFRNTVLVNPSNDCFPGRENSAEAMARLIFTKVTEYAGLSHWSFQLQAHNDGELNLSLPLQLGNPERTTPLSEAQHLPIPYNPVQLANPQALIAHFAHVLALYKGSQAQGLPPGGEDNWPHVTEVLAVYMGFGVMLANSAFNVRISSCGSCQGPSTDRQSYLSQYDITYALAIYSVLKNLTNKTVLKYLKKSLRPYFKKAVKDVLGRKEDLLRLQQCCQSYSPLTL